MKSCEIDKVSLKEAFNNNNGKTSSNKILGLVTGFVCLAIFVMLIIYYFFKPNEGPIILQFVDKAIFFYGIGSGVMIGKTLAASFGNNNRLNVGEQTQHNHDSHEYYGSSRENNLEGN